MKPYYSDASVTIYHGDYSLVVNNLGLTFDCIIADPPYGQTSLDWDRWPLGWPDAVRRVLAHSGSMWCFGSLKMFMREVREFDGWTFAQDVVWEKHNGSGFAADRFRRVHDQAVQFYRSDAKWSDVYRKPQTTPDATKRTRRSKRRPPHLGYIDSTPYVSEDGGPLLMRSVIYARSTHGSAVNETQKPVDIVAPLIEYACPPGGLILEPFGGAAPAALYAAATGRRAVVCDVREDQCEAAANRVSGGQLFRKSEGSA